MTTVTLDIEAIERLIAALKPKDKIRLIENLEKQTWPDRLKPLLRRIEQKARKYPITEQEINYACEEVRHKRHVHRGHWY